jgi:hypothetical protein
MRPGHDPHAPLLRANYGASGTALTWIKRSPRMGPEATARQCGLDGWSPTAGVSAPLGKLARLGRVETGGDEQWLAGVP